MKKTVLLYLALFMAWGAAAQSEKDTTWKSGTSGTITFSQVSLSNWAAGGENSYSADGQFDFFANYKKNKTSWKNTLNTAYGLVKIIDDNLKKSNDQVDFESKLGYDAAKLWNYSIMFNFRTQFTEGYNYGTEPRTLISDFMAPAYMTLSAGMDYQPSEHLSVFLSPLSGKTTIVNNDSLSDIGAFGVTPGNTSMHEYGAMVKVKFEKDIVENINFGTKADFFSAYNNNPENIDVNWEVMINMKVNKYFSANLRTHLIYDHDTRIANNAGIKKPRVQFKESFGFGIRYQFPEKTE
jgi:hypothetical protein